MTDEITGADAPAVDDGVPKPPKAPRATPVTSVAPEVAPRPVVTVASKLPGSFWIDGPGGQRIRIYGRADGQHRFPNLEMVDGLAQTSGVDAEAWNVWQRASIHLPQVREGRVYAVS